MHGVDTGGGGWGLGAEEPPILSGSTLCLLETIVDLYQNLMLALSV